MSKLYCWWDARRHCIHGDERAKACVEAPKGKDFCQEIIDSVPSIRKRVQESGREITVNRSRE